MNEQIIDFQLKKKDYDEEKIIKLKKRVKLWFQPKTCPLKKSQLQ